MAPELPSGWTAKTTQYAERVMVAAANPLAVDAGVAMLAHDGSAVDAAFAVQDDADAGRAALVRIGSGAFLLRYDPADTQRAAYDGRETAPAAATPDMFLDQSGKPLEFTRAVDGGLSVGTPGILKLFELGVADINSGLHQPYENYPSYCFSTVMTVPLLSASASWFEAGW